MGQTATYTYRGYRYKPEIDKQHDDGGFEKIFHHVITPWGERIHFDCSPYHEPSVAEFRLWIELGRPKRVKGNFKGVVDIGIASTYQKKEQI